MISSYAFLEDFAMADDKKKRLTPEEQLKALDDAEKNLMERLQKRRQSIKDQARFGGTGAITQQKIILGSFLWKYSQEDPEFKKMVNAITLKMKPEEKEKIQKFLDVIAVK